MGMPGFAFCGATRGKWFLSLSAFVGDKVWARGLRSKTEDMSDAGSHNEKLIHALTKGCCACIFCFLSNWIIQWCQTHRSHMSQTYAGKLKKAKVTFLFRLFFPPRKQNKITGSLCKGWTQAIFGFPSVKLQGSSGRGSGHHQNLTLPWGCCSVSPYWGQHHWCDSSVWGAPELFLLWRCTKILVLSLNLPGDTHCPFPFCSTWEIIKTEAGTRAQPRSPRLLCASLWLTILESFVNNLTLLSCLLFASHLKIDAGPCFWAWWALRKGAPCPWLWEEGPVWEPGCLSRDRWLKMLWVMQIQALVCREITGTRASCPNGSICRCHVMKNQPLDDALFRGTLVGRGHHTETPRASSSHTLCWVEQRI